MKLIKKVMDKIRSLNAFFKKVLTLEEDLKHIVCVDIAIMSDKNLKINEKYLLMIIIMHVNSKTCIAELSLEKIKKLIQLENKGFVIEKLKILSEKGYIKIIKNPNGGRNMYKVNKYINIVNVPKGTCENFFITYEAISYSNDTSSKNVTIDKLHVKLEDNVPKLQSEMKSLLDENTKSIKKALNNNDKLLKSIDKIKV